VRAVISCSPTPGLCTRRIHRSLPTPRVNLIVGIIGLMPVWRIAAGRHASDGQGGHVGSQGIHHLRVPTLNDGRVTAPLTTP